MFERHTDRGMLGTNPNKPRAFGRSCLVAVESDYVMRLRSFHTELLHGSSVALQSAFQECSAKRAGESHNNKDVTQNACPFVKPEVFIHEPGCLFSICYSTSLFFFNDRSFSCLSPKDSWSWLPHCQLMKAAAQITVPSLSVSDALLRGSLVWFRCCHAIAPFYVFKAKCSL